MANLFIPGQVIGIIGGGHQSRMICLAAQKLGIEVGVMDPDENCPAGEVAAWQIIAKTKSRNGLKRLEQMCDVVIYEEETVTEELLSKLTGMVDIPQGSAPIEFTHNRIKERLFLEESNVNIAPYRVVYSMVDVHEAIEQLGLPCVLKAVDERTSKSNVRIIKYIEELSNCIDLVSEGPCILESLIPKAKELSVLVANNGQDAPIFFPIAERIAISSKVTGVVAPVKLPSEMEEEVYRIADILSATLHVQGILNIEMFVNDIGTIYVNTLSAVPGSDGYYTEQACSISQYDAHVKGICGWPIPKIQSKGRWLTLEITGREYASALGQIPYQKNWHFHFFGRELKKKSTVMGYVSIPIKKVTDGVAAVIKSQIWNS